MKLIYSFPIIFFANLPLLVFAQGADKPGYYPLVTIHGVNEPGKFPSFENYINFLYGAAIAVAALLAVVKPIVAGVKYMVTDIVPNKSQAIEDIKGALLGLLLIIGAVVVLNTINPELKENNITLNKIPDFDAKTMIIDRPSLQAIADKQGSDLTVGLNECVTEDSSISKDGTKKLTTADFSNCSPAEREQVQADFQKRCKAGEEGKTASVYASGGAGSNRITCSIPIPGAEESKQLANNENLDKTYIKVEGTVTTYNADAACKKKADATSNPVYTYRACMSLQPSEFKASCESGDRYGKYDGTNKSSLTCTVPSSKAEITSLDKEFNQYLAANPDLKYQQSNLTITSLTKEQRAEVCKLWNSAAETSDNWVDTDVCLVY